MFLGIGHSPVRIGVLVGIVAAILAAIVYNSFQDKPEPVTPGSNAAYVVCVDSASRHLMEMIPGLTLKDAIAKAEVSPRCSAIL